MTKEEMFAKAYWGVLGQGGLAKGPLGGCYYEMCDGKRCNAGQLLTTEQLRLVQGAGKNSAFFSDIAVMFPEFQPVVGFVKGLQVMHDISEDLEEYKDRMAGFALEHGLAFPPERLQ